MYTLFEAELKKMISNSRKKTKTINGKNGSTVLFSLLWHWKFKSINWHQIQLASRLAGYLHTTMLPDTIRVAGTLSKDQPWIQLYVTSTGDNWYPTSNPCPFPQHKHTIPYVWECPLPLWVFPSKSIDLYRRVTLTLQWWQTNSTSVLQYSKDQGILIFFQNINSLLTSDTATPWGKTERLFRSIKILNITLGLGHSGKFLRKLYQFVIKQLKMEDYPMPRNNCLYFYLHIRKKGKNEG